ncbi:MAG: metabolite traffic protein EboE [Pleurocapsa sp.]
MKLAANNDLHLTYCTNIHPGESWSEVKNNLQQYIPQLKTRLAPDQPFGIGLRLADIAARELLEGDNLTQLQTWLKEQNLYVFTLNGFPYGGFHHQVVKDRVYAPDWSKKERLDYTLRLIQILVTLLPDNLDGGISTVPLSYKPWWQNDQSKKTVFHQSTVHLAQIVATLAAIAQDTGKLLHLDLEPEPDGMLENTSEMIDFFQNWLFPIAGTWLQQELGVNQQTAETLITEHIRVCYDTCHFAIEYEEPQEIIQHFQEAGIKIGKIQLSSAIKIDIPSNIEQRQLILEKLTPFAESTYLHQVIARNCDRTLHRYSDLATALPHLLTTQAQEWRTHFHVPLFIRNYQLFESTQEHIVQLLRLLPDNFVGHHLEIETYTWEVLPPEMKLDILTSIEREYQWVLSLNIEH